MKSIYNSKPLIKCSQCGKFHLPINHQVFSDFPIDPLELVNDYIQMGVIKANSLKVAEQITQQDMIIALDRTSLTQGKISQLAKDLIAQAGGIDAILSAAFGGKSKELLQDTMQHQAFSRRRFLQQVLIGAALVTLANCTPAPEITNEAETATTLEKKHLKIGFIPITCATPIIMSDPLGFYDKYGLKVELVKMNSWAQVRDSAIAGELDAYHTLSPMPIAMTLGLGSPAIPIKLASIENTNGNAITVAMKHKNKVKNPEDFKGFRIAIPFVYSMHNLLLRYYLATGKINPDKDVEVVTLPPAEMLDRLKTGLIDAMIVAEPFNQIAVQQKIGFIHLLTQELWSGHPCCAFAASDSWIKEHPSTFRAVNKAIIDGANYARNPNNRREIAKAIAKEKYLNTPEKILEEILTGDFEDGLGNSRHIPQRIDFDPYPWKSFSYWITSQLRRWKLLPSYHETDEAIADEVFMTGLARQLAKQLGQTPPTLIMRYEKLKYEWFDPTDPQKYLTQQIQKYGF
ncbi:ABC transporter substrate-binding protein [Aerosakkonemataceae cyanobacterium BLCC-F154]|uniref:ABC transporter substrate-binding protein n=1 Tax=Floridaenema fluviatile BLCC-F154 TaxID=3153640 RepID=A0ABV4YCA5_9CYAN